MATTAPKPKPGLQFSPKVGQILECNYGEYPAAQADQASYNFNQHIPPEMVKNRLVVVLNGKLGTSCLVVPLSSTEDPYKANKGMHVPLPPTTLPDIKYFSQVKRWAKADMVQQVSKVRLKPPKDAAGRPLPSLLLSRELVTDIQRAVIKSINASALIASEVMAD